MFRSFWATHDKNEGLRLHICDNGFHFAASVSVEEAEAFCDKIRETIAKIPRIGTFADLGVEEPT